MRIRLLLLVLSGLLLATNVSVAASSRKCPSVSKKEKTNKKRAGKFFKRGQRLTREMRLSAALDSYLCSLKLMPHEHTVFNIAQLTKFYKDKKKARRKLKRFLKKYPNNLVAEDIRALIDELGPQSGEKTAAELEPEPETVSSPMSEPRTVDTEPQHEDEAAAVAEEESSFDFNMRTVSVISFGTAASTLILGVIFQGISTSAKIDSDLSHISGAEKSDYLDQGKKFQVAAGLMYGLTAVFGITGTILLFKDLDNRQSAKTIADGPQVVLLPAPTGLVLQGSF